MAPKSAPPGRNSVRIIGGAWRGRRLTFPTLLGLRPTPDRVRETLFNWLQAPITGARCLDLFAGSGALGFEALSRGAGSVIFVEQSPLAARNLGAGLARLGATTKARVVEMGAGRFLKSAGGAAGAFGGAAFDVVFLDPPFGQNALSEYIPLLAAGGWLKVHSLVFLESERSAGVPALPPHWSLLKSKTAGAVGYHLVRVDAHAGI